MAEFPGLYLTPPGGGDGGGGGGGSWSLLGSDDIVSQNDPSTMIAVPLSIDGDGWWSIGVTQPSLGSRHIGSGALVFTLALPRVGEFANEEFFFLLEMARPTSGGWGMGMGIGDYSNSKTQVVQGQFVVGTTPDKWRAAYVNWSTLTPSGVEVPNDASAVLRGHVVWLDASNDNVHLSGVLNSGASGTSDIYTAKVADTIASPEMQLVVSTSENGAQAGTVRFRPWIFRPSGDPTLI